MSEEKSTAVTATSFVGRDQLYHKRARQALPILVRQAKSHQTITYGKLAEELGISNPRVLNYPLGSIGAAIAELNSTRITNIPMIQALVVNKDKNQPGKGIDNILSAEQKMKLASMSRAYVFQEILNEVFNFPHWDDVLLNFGLEPITYEDDPLELEYLHRIRMFNDLIMQGGPVGVTPKTLNELMFYQGQAGIWRDTKRTSQILGDDIGITVSFTHRGDHYPDDLSESGLIYHYPVTNRIGSTDENEIQATKIAASASLPIFVITTNNENSSLRDVTVGYITEWSEEEKSFIVEFSEQRPSSIKVAPEPETETQPFNLDDSNQKTRKQTIKTSTRSQSFKKDVINRYGASCSVCDLDILSMLDGAHIKGKQYKGTDDPRNGLILCANHHRAFDSKLFFIHPSTYEIHPSPKGPTLQELKITRTNILHLVNLPHIDALQWFWDQFH